MRGRMREIRDKEQRGLGVRRRSQVSGCEWADGCSIASRRRGIINPD